MPEENKTVDIDTSGPGAEIELESTEKPESGVEATESTTAEQTEDTSVESVAAEQAEEKGEADQETTKETSEEVEKKKKELEDYSEGVKKRIAKLTKKMREAERREQAALDYAKKVITEQENLASRYSKLDTGYVSEMEKRIVSSKEAAIAKLQAARDQGDLKSEVEAQSEISRLGYEEARLADLKANQESQKQTNVSEQETSYQPQAYQQEQPSIDPKAQAWLQKNGWFTSDKVMKSAAIAIHESLVDEEGYDPKSDEYYQEIDKRIRVEFPHKFGNNENTNTTIAKPTQTVASANRSSKQGRRTVKLTPSQVAIAKKLGVPLEEYAKQLNVKE